MPYRLLVVRYRVLITGQAQGVNFRAACRRVALQHGVRGWVRNLPDGVGGHPSGMLHQAETRPAWNDENASAPNAGRVSGRDPRPAT